MTVLGDRLECWKTDSFYSISLLKKKKITIFLAEYPLKFSPVFHTEKKGGKFLWKRLKPLTHCRLSNLCEKLAVKVFLFHFAALILEGLNL